MGGNRPAYASGGRYFYRWTVSDLLLFVFHFESSGVQLAKYGFYYS
jgi:hypothetical protein